MLIWLSLLLAAQEPPPAPARVPWTTSRLSGAPEAPPPLRTERAFPNLKFAAPIHALPGPEGNRFWVLEQHGKLHSFPDDEAAARTDVAIDLRKDLRGLDRIPDCKGVAETYALAFHPRFAENRQIFVMYILAHKQRNQNLAKGSRISRFTVTKTDPPRLDPDSEQVLVEWLGGGHNGCDLQFGPDGFLYFSTGDGAGPSPPDTLRTGQDCSDLLSCILRIDVDRADPGLPYAVPKDNPFTGLTGVRPEIWAFGFRNPWRMSFDRATGHLWTGDVGWESWELVFRVEKGANYGWSLMEGPQPVDLKGRLGPAPIRPPTQILPHPEAASITGGFVYHGKTLPALERHYVYGDWETRRVWASRVTPDGLAPQREIARTDLRIVAFAERRDGELLLVDHEGGGLHRLVPNVVPADAAPFPRRLGETGLFAGPVREQHPAPGVVPYSINAPRWADGAVGERYLAVPGGASPGFANDKIVWPRDSALAKTLSLDGRKVETQVLHFDGWSWNAYSYLWNDDESDADLVPAGGAEKSFRIGGRERRWSVPPRAACLSCHNPWPGFSLTMNYAQLERMHPFPGGGRPLKQALVSMKLLPDRLPGGKPLSNPYDTRLGLAERARSYLAVNCSTCHRFGGGGSALIDLRHEIAEKEMKLLDVPPLLGGFELDDPRLVAPGDPARSVLLCRLSKLGQGHMPRLGSTEVDADGAALLAEWIASLGPRPARPAAPLAKRLETPLGALELSLAWPGLPEAERAEALRLGLASSRPVVRDLIERFVPAEQRRRRLGTSIVAEELLTRPGDAARGRRLFEGGGVQCKACHRAGEGPERLGPDLDKVGTRLTRAQILESLLDPSRTVDPKFAGILVQTNGGDVLSGILVEKTAAQLVIRDAEQLRTLPLASVARMSPQARSLMPDQLLQDLTLQEAADLLEFLAGLK